MAVTRGAKRKAEAEAERKAKKDRSGTDDPETVDLPTEDEDAPGDEDWVATKVRGSRKKSTKRCRGNRKVAHSHQPPEKEAEAHKPEPHVCGICLSEGKEEGKLDCCQHEFCFDCILEWSKVETRCPMCKQRFSTIVKPAKSGVARSRKKTVKVQERNQVYEPSAEEVMAMVAPQTDIMCHYCQELVDEEELQMCCVCQISVTHIACAQSYDSSSGMEWTCRFCLERDVQDELVGDAAEDMENELLMGGHQLLMDDNQLLPMDNNQLMDYMEDVYNRFLLGSVQPAQHAQPAQQQDEELLDNAPDMDDDSLEDVQSSGSCTSGRAGAPGAAGQGAAPPSEGRRGLAMRRVMPNGW